MEKLYKEFQPMIQKKVYEFASKYRRDPSDVLSEANEIFIKAVSDYKKEKASFSTFLFIQLKKLNNDCRKEVRKWSGKVTDSLDEPALGEDQGNMAPSEFKAFQETPEYFADQTHSSFEFADSTKILSDDACLILKMTLSGELDTDTGTYFRPVTCGKFRNYCTQELGWKHSHFWNTWDELKSWYAEQHA